MSTIEEINLICAACGRQSPQGRLMSFSTFSGPDLDFRPAEMLRSTMHYWIMACPYCGYAAKDIGKRPRVARDTLEQLYGRADNELPRLAYRFHKHALHREHLKDIRAAIRAYLCAAWVCDDAGDEARARQMRAKCLQLTQRRMKRCHSRDWNRYALLEADLLRRMGVFEEMFMIDTSDKRMSEAAKAVIVCQQALARRRDVAAHCCEEFDLEME